MVATGRRAPLRLGAIVLLLLAQGWLFAVLLPRTGLRHRVLWLEIATTVTFGAAAFLLSRARLTPRALAALVLGGGIAFQAIAVMTSPVSSDDDFRYVWDAKVQLSGVDPYRYAPTAPQLTHLRDGFLFPQRADCNWPIPGGCSTINRPNVHTIYPPVAEGSFALIRVASFGGRGNHLPLQLAAALGSIVVAWLLYRRRRARDRPLWTVALWAWCPVTVVEFGNNAHIDWLAAMFVVLALTSEASRRSGPAGVLAGAAIATKLYPLLVLPSLLRRRPVLAGTAALATVALSYLPHVAVVGTKVIGYLPGYLRDERYTSGSRFLLLEPVLPHVVAVAAAVIALALAAIWTTRRTDPARPEDTAVVMVGVAMLVTTPAQGWYSGVLLALIGMSGAVEWLPVALVPGLVYLVDGNFAVSLAAGQLLYAATLVVTLSWLAAARGWSVGRTLDEVHRCAGRVAGRVRPGDRDAVAGVVGGDGARHVTGRIDLGAADRADYVTGREPGLRRG